MENTNSHNDLSIDEEYEINHLSQPLIAKAKSRADPGRDIDEMLLLDIKRPASMSLKMNLFKSNASASFKDVQESVQRASLTKVDWLKKFYKMSDDSRPFNRIDETNEFESAQDSEKQSITPKFSNEDQTVGSLFLQNQLIDMGFDRAMVKNLLVYDKDLIGTDITKAVDFLCKTSSGWMHTFVPEAEEKLNSQKKYRIEESSILENDSFGPSMKER